MSIQTDDFAAPPDKRVVSAAPASPAEEAMERALRPKGLAEYVGQAKVREQLEIFIDRRRKRMVHRIITTILFVKLEHREISHPERRVDVRGDQVLAFGNFVSQRTKTCGDDLRLARHNQY